ncbi:2Fe-2S iron-sulfur cluster-binding protein [Cupriavidus basilensis]
MHTVEIAGSGQRYPCAPQQNLLRAMEALSKRGIPAGCRGGGRGVCKVRIEAGRYRTGKMSFGPACRPRRRAVAWRWRARPIRTAISACGRWRCCSAAWTGSGSGRGSRKRRDQRSKLAAKRSNKKDGPITPSSRRPSWH